MFCNSKLPSCTENSYKHSSQYLFQNYLWSLQDHLIDLVGMEDTGNDLERCFLFLFSF